MKKIEKINFFRKILRKACIPIEKVVICVQQAAARCYRNTNLNRKDTNNVSRKASTGVYCKRSSEWGNREQLQLGAIPREEVRRTVLLPEGFYICMPDRAHRVPECLK